MLPGKWRRSKQFHIPQEDLYCQALTQPVQCHLGYPDRSLWLYVEHATYVHSWPIRSFFLGQESGNAWTYPQRILVVYYATSGGVIRSLGETRLIFISSLVVVCTYLLFGCCLL
jgi:hypothetical protein